VQVVALAVELRMWRHRHCQVKVATASRRARPFARHPHALPGAHARRDLHVHVMARALPAAAVTRRARLAAHVAGAVARRARLVHLERECLARAGEGFLEGDVDARLYVFAAPARARTASVASEEVFVPDATASAARPEIAEDRPEEVRKISGVTGVLRVEAAASGCAAGRALGVPLPVRTKGVVPLALLGVGQHLVRLGRLAKPLARIFGLRDVRMVLAGQLAIGRPDRLFVGLPVDAENLVIVPEFDSHRLTLQGV
jgi:hypothetical protein